MGRWQLLAAVVLIPLLDAVLGYVTFRLAWRLWNQGGVPSVASLQLPMNFAVMAGVLGLLVMMTVALPVSFWLIRRGQTSVRHFAVAGVCLGNLPLAVYLWLVLVVAFVHVVQGTLREHLSPVSELLAGCSRAICVGSVIGAASGIVFWWIAVRGLQHLFEPA